MIKVLGEIPKGKFGIAVSGGIDSMVCLDFLLKGKYNPEVIYFNHNTEHGSKSEIFVKDFCNKNNLTLNIDRKDITQKSNK